MQRETEIDKEVIVKNKKLKTDNNMKTLALGEAEQDFLFSVFWGETDRKQIISSDNEIGPNYFHHWGTRNKTIKRSVTLKNLVEKGGIKHVNNFKKTFNQILAELELGYTVENLQTFQLSDKAVAYDIRSIPRWSFYGVGRTREEAVDTAARRGLEYFIGLVS